ncbi:GH25 family lysozyme [Paraburkholderia sp. BL23I1N1]|uniref:GH25 family lysozyme n=1 Tax=Paraburkholderia sp. BL23I1N1 TaxID=1938802 RepID=UPI0016029AE3|nr:GH25 family lysozyme [Paraburkholderia sp. BL23I1N1]
MKWIVLLLLSVTSVIPLSARAYICENGAEVKNENYCQFITYGPEKTIIDDRFVWAMSPAPGDHIRSIALVVGIGKYPHFNGDSISKAVENDIDNLTKFLKEDQGFDEIIVLKNEDVTQENLNYFLDEYVPNQGKKYRGFARFLMTYSGHGLHLPNALPHNTKQQGGRKTSRVPISPKRLETPRAALLLSNAESELDTLHSYPLENLKRQLVAISPDYFHVLALINTCYGGAIYGWDQGAIDDNTMRGRGAFAMTAGSNDMQAATLGKENDGSIFFDSIIHSVKMGSADPTALRIAIDGKTVQRGGFVRLGALATSVSTDYEDINSQNIVTTTGVLQLAGPWVGSMEPAGVNARGGFFFLTPFFLSNGLAAPILPPVPSSSVPNHPEIQVFAAPEQYPIRGVDVSAHQEIEDWNFLAKQYRFVYLRGNSWHGPDPVFAKRWEYLRQMGIDRGLYVVFDYCSSALHQMQYLSALEAIDEEALPTVIDLEEPSINESPQQLECLHKSGVSATRKAVLEMAKILNKKFNKTPMIYGSQPMLNAILDEHFSPYMIWLSTLKKASLPGDDNLGLYGANPWTLWQYSSREIVPGIKRPIDISVFFGDEAM